MGKRPRQGGINIRPTVPQHRKHIRRPSEILTGKHRDQALLTLASHTQDGTGGRHGTTLAVELPNPPPDGNVTHPVHEDHMHLPLERTSHRQHLTQPLKITDAEPVA
jgi:hypothetical protein